MYLKQESARAGKVVFQEVLETVQGGHTIDLTASGLVDGSIIAAGTLFGATKANETARKVVPIKTATLTADAGNTATDYQVAKGHVFKVGDYLAYTKGGKAYAITAIDTTNANYDVLTVGTTLAVALVTGQGLFQSTATGASAAAYVRPLGLLFDDVKVETGCTAALVNRGTVYARRVPFLPDEIMALIPTIIISNSY